MAEEKQHKPTQNKIKKARKEGTVLKGPLLTQISALLTGLLTIIILVKYSWEKNVVLLQYGFEDLSKINSAYLKEWLHQCCVYTLTVLCTIVLTSILIEFLQVGFKFESSLLSIKAKRMNPSSGFKKIGTGLKNIWETGARLLVLIPCALFLIWLHVSKASSAYMSGSIGNYLLAWETVFSFFVAILSLLFLLAGLEFIVKRKEFYKDLSMSHDELQREFKDDEGDPQMKGARKSLHMSIMNQDLVKQIRKSKVIVVKKSS